MRKEVLCIVVVITVSLALGLSSLAEMTSTHYRISSSVLSGGGGPTGTATFVMNGTVGQSSPITECDSGSYNLYSGFWYTVDIIPLAAQGVPLPAILLLLLDG